MAGARFLALAVSSELTFFWLWANDISPLEAKDFVDFANLHHEWVQLFLLPVIAASWLIWWRKNRGGKA